MSRTTRTSRNYKHNNLPPVRSINLPEKMSRKRLAAIGILLAVGLFFIGYGIAASRAEESGWVEVEPNTSVGCAAELSFRYYNDPETVDFDRLAEVYTDLCTRADSVYDPAGTDEGTGGLGLLNTHPNETVTIAPELYETLSMLQEQGNRVIYLGPVYETYTGLYSCTEDTQAELFDPQKNPEIAKEFEEIAAYASDPEMIDLELTGENQARLVISEVYQNFAKEHGIHQYLGLSWLKNAAILKDIAAGLKEAGFTNGYVQSYEGFGTNLSATEETFSLGVFSGGGKAIATMEYEAPLSFVFLRSYSLMPVFGDQYYEYQDGTVSGPYLDPADGHPKHALDDLLVYSDTADCLTLALEACPVYLTEEFDGEALVGAGLHAVWCEDSTVYTTGDPQNVSAQEGWSVQAYPGT